MNSANYEQLPLAIQLRDEATFSNFYGGENGALLQSLQCQLEGGERYIYIYGAQGSGRSHLLQAACHQAEARGQHAAYLPLKEVGNFPPAEVLEGLEGLDLVCLDDIEAVLGRPDWESELFQLFNRLQASKVALLISGRSAVRQLAINLPDLASRISWGAVFQIAGLSEEQQCEVLNQRAAERGLLLSKELIQFIYHRSERDTAALLAVLDRLDQASLRDQRRLTVPFVKQILGW